MLILFYQHGVVICQPAKIGSEAAAAEAAAAVTAASNDVWRLMTTKSHPGL